MRSENYTNSHRDMCVCVFQKQNYRWKVGILTRKNEPILSLYILTTRGCVRLIELLAFVKLSSYRLRLQNFPPLEELQKIYLLLR
jgi:hypothetical protein